MRRPGRLRPNHTPHAAEFWRQCPDDPEDAYAIRDFWIAGVGRRDRSAMAVTGWAFGVMDRFDDPAPADFLTDAFQAWRATPGYTPAAGRRFLEEMLAEPIPDGWSGAPEAWSESDESLAAAMYEARCWAASELLELGVAPVMEQRLYRAIAAAPRHVVPPRSAKWALDFAARHELPSPFAPWFGATVDQTPE